MKIDEKLIPPCPDPNKDGLIWKNVSDDIKLVNGRANPWGWSYYEMEWEGENFGQIISGSPEITGKNWQMIKVTDPSDGLEHVFFFKGLTTLEWDAIEFLNESKSGEGEKV